ncbi:MAG: metallophosphoesterase [Actinomycetota bacterium]|nr:metallophosphoesterase [Actinomycetota bacterium]
MRLGDPLSLAQAPLRIVQVSDLHCGTPTFKPELMEAVVARCNRLRPDVIVVVGDLTAEGYEWEYSEVAGWLARFDATTLVVPGNHDARNLGYVHFERCFGERFWRYRMHFTPERAERLQASGATFVGVDSSEPDLNEGRVGREWYSWIRDQFDHPGDIKVFVIHHHLVSLPNTGRERNTVSDAGDLLDVLTGAAVDIVLSGHKHVPFFWGLNGTLICNSGTAATWRVRGLTPPSWNEVSVDASTIKVHVHYEEGRRGLAMIRTRANRTTIREALYLTDSFRASNPIPVE